MGTGAITRITLSVRKNLHSKKMTGTVSEIFTLISTLLQLKLKRDLSHNVLLNKTPITLDAKKEDHILLALTTLTKLIPFIKSPARDGKIGTLYIGEDRRIKHNQMDKMTIETQEEWMLDGEIQKAGKIDVTLAAPLTFWVE